jgi:hypothetical protein
LTNRQNAFTRLKSIAGISAQQLKVNHLLAFCTANGIAAMRNKPKQVLCEAIVDMKVLISNAVLLLL